MAESVKGVAEPVPGIPQLANNWIDSSFDTSTFDYQWTIRNVGARLALTSSSLLKSPPFSPDVKVNGYKTKWQLSFKHQYGFYISLQISMEYEDCTYALIPKAEADIGLRAVVRFSVLKRHTEESNVGVTFTDKSSYQELYLTCVPSNYDKASLLTSTVNIPYKADVGATEFATLDSEFVTAACHKDKLTIYCRVNIFMLNNPKHKLVVPPSPVVKESVFDLGQKMEEARRNNLFTDVTLVAGSKEFKVHRAVLASQSTLFRTRFELSSESSYIKVTDVSPAILEAMISFMYTGKVYNVEKLAATLLEAAANYGIVELRQHCERVLAESLDCKNVVENIVRAHTHNADQLKGACMSFITKNPSEVQKNEQWKSLSVGNDNQELRVEVLDAIAKSLVKR